MKIGKKYTESNPKQWGVEQVFMGMIKDIGDLSKYLMVNGQYRKDIEGDIRKKIEHEISDVLFNAFVLAKYLDVDVEKAYDEGMRELEEKLKI